MRFGLQIDYIGAMFRRSSRVAPKDSRPSDSPSVRLDLPTPLDQQKGDRTPSLANRTPASPGGMAGLESSSDSLGSGRQTIAYTNALNVLRIRRRR